jgi:hypothetical protein
MRHGYVMLVAGAALLIGGCGSNGEADLAANADSRLTADKITANDVTAIDAVTGEAANMAADVDYSNFLDNESNASANATGNTTGKAAAPTPKASTPPKAKPSPAQPAEPAEPANTAD